MIVQKFKKFNKLPISKMSQGYFENIKKNGQLFIESKKEKYPVLDNENFKRNVQYFIGIIE